MCVTSGLVPNEKARAPALQVNARRHGRVLEKKPLVLLPACLLTRPDSVANRAGPTRSLSLSLRLLAWTWRRGNSGALLLAPIVPRCSADYDPGSWPN